MKQLEANLERQYLRACEVRSVLALKFKPPGSDGWPDRLLLCGLGGPRVAFYELKAEGEKPEKLQDSRMRLLRAMGFTVGWGDNLADAIAFLEDWLRG